MKEFLENVKYYLWDVPKGWYRSIKHWFYCNWNKQHWRLCKQAFFSYGWDGSFLTVLEEKQIDKALKWFSHHQRMIDEQYEEIMRSLNWAKYCIHVINNDGDDLFEFTGDFKFIPISNGYSQLDASEVKYHYKGPYINTRNAKRFTSNMDLVYRHPHELYILKCKRLYYKIREKYTDYWWD